MNIKNLVIFLVMIVALDSCSETNDDSLVSEIIESIDSLKQIYVASYASRFVRTVRIIGQENGKTIQKISGNSFYKIMNSN